ncbi:phosphoribosyltransferase family protein [Acidocella sp.]|uniref:phosphoribosyltransferase family protein n=1 Tax=Acidocella sp. TaxID=50710 RepID=UPI003D06820B
MADGATSRNAELFTGQTHHLDVEGWAVELPIVAIKPDFGISLMMLIDMGVGFVAHAGARLAAHFASARPEVVVGPATLGIPLAIEVSRALGLDRYVVLQKSPKLHLRDALTQDITSITSAGVQKLLLDRRAVPLLAGKRVLLVDDVVASGSSLAGALALLRKAGAEIVGAGAVLTEAHEWEAALGADAALVHGLAHIPQFQPAGGVWRPIPGT